MNRRQLLYGAGLFAAGSVYTIATARAKAQIQSFALLDYEPKSMLMGADTTTFKSIYAVDDIPLQTDPHSKFWKDALPIYAGVDNYNKPLPSYRTEISSRWTEHNLYILFVCPYEELYLKPGPKIVAETYELWNWEVAELFISSDFTNIRRYKEFELSPQGEWLDIDVNLDLPDHTVGWTWNSGFEVSARIDSKTRIWYGAMRIPFAAIDSHAPIEGRVFRANFFRSQGPRDRQKLIAWKPPMSDTFHSPESFGRLELVK
jgi:hypothetical protein